MMRRYLTDAERRELLLRQHGLCAAPNCLSEGPFEADHTIPHVWDDKKPDQLLCVPCHRAKTKRDVKAIAKVKRIVRGPKQPKRKLRSRGFDKSLSKKMNGEVIRNGR